MADFVIYGTELEDLDDEKSGVSNKRPLKVEEQVVKDERGRRRFHGAFTGGFSAGYFNTVGSKEGWAPKQFRSTRDERSERIDYKPEDFMDEEDLGEFGIAARRMKTSVEAGGGAGTSKHLLAWERSTQSSLESSLSAGIQKIIKPTSDSMGIQLLKKMGWREGQGIGPKMSRKALEKQNMNEDRVRGKHGVYNEDVVKEADEMAPNFLFAPTDLDASVLKSCEGVHGLGYRGIEQTSVLSEKYGTVEAALKMQKKGKGISGQLNLKAFGVGAFEDDDVNIYTNYDFSQYDFSIGGGGAQDAPCSSNDTSFVMASRRQLPRPFFEPPRLPPNFRPVHTPIHPDISHMPENIKQFGEKMNHVQRAKFLGEVDPKAVLELIRDRDREKLSAPKSEDILKNAFEEEPMKQARFKQYVNYLKRGLNFPQPSDMTTLEWEQELKDFQNILPPELRSLIPEVKMRQKPLARIDVAAPIAEVLKSKFTSGSGIHSGKMKEMKSDERLAAVKMKMFGEKTRTTHEWHPAKNLAKRFNVPDPYPSCTLTGIPHLQKATKTETLANLGADMSAFGSTAQELEFRASIENTESKREQKTLEKEKGLDNDMPAANEKPSEEFLKAIFGGSDESDSDSDNDEIIPQTTGAPSTSAEPLSNVAEESSKPVVTQKVLTVMDLPLGDDENEEFGPAPPPNLSTVTIDTEPDSTNRRKGSMSVGLEPVSTGREGKRKKNHKHYRKEKKRKKEKKKSREREKVSFGSVTHGRSHHHHHKPRSRSKSSNSTISID